ncbi:M1 family metallopeptidase [Salinimicrobium marinum]|uniref:M1 family metallopeptidase n=1 Tax=Salinimicrobium marinum TaxID=680283 RepID=UPI001671BDA7|nr:M1 family metallopeptidase [Salinimicrobium marinum]
MKRSCFFIFLLISFQGVAQKNDSQLTHTDSLRGSLNAEREWWDVQRYDITIEPNFHQKMTTGKNIITYKIVQEKHSPYMQIDLQEPLQIDSIIYNDKQKLTFTREGSAWHVKTGNQRLNSVNKITVFYHGKPREAVRAPWDGGWTFTKDSLSRPWMTVTCQGLGASVWYPNKDHQSDEPDKGASLTMIVPNDLVAVANGRLIEKKKALNEKLSYKWEVENSINNYNIIPYIGHYVNFKGNYLGLKGNLDLDYWVLDYNENKAKDYLPKEVHNMLDSFEYWFGPYPFYEDGYKIIETEHTGMEHQSAIAYGNHYKPGYRGRDGSGTGWGMKWDFIVIHESGHEWFGNNITTNDLADMYIHESFTNYSETLFVDSMFGEEAANEYNYGIRQGIRNDKPIIPAYGVNGQGSGDMYPKGGNMLHSIRHSINNDQLFRNILAGLNQSFYHETVDGSQIQAYISEKAGYDYSKVFEQYLTTTQIPQLNLFKDIENNQVYYKWSNSIKGFNLPISLKNNNADIRIVPNLEWQQVTVSPDEKELFTPEAIEKMYYVEVKEVKSLEL